MTEGRRVYPNRKPDGRPVLTRGMIARMQTDYERERRRAERKLQKYRRAGAAFARAEEEMERLQREAVRNNPARPASQF